MSRRRYLHSFTNVDGGNEFIFPEARYEWSGSQALRSPQAQVIGRDFPIRLLGSRPSQMGAGQERLRFVAHGTAQEQDAIAMAARSKLYVNAYGKLWLKSWVEDDHGDLQERMEWAMAELAEMPEITVSYQSIGTMPIIFGFTRFTPFFDATPISASATKTASPATLEVTNHGNIAAKRVVITVMGTFDDIKIVNDANGHELYVNFTGASSDDGIKLDTSVPAIYTTDDGGVNWTPNYGIYNSPPVTQKLLSFELEPGAQELTLTSGGSPNYSIEVAAEAPFA